jgi:hypothetical protein
MMMTVRSGSPAIEIDPDTYEHLSRRVAESEFDEASAYVEYVLKTLFAELEGDSPNEGNNDEVRDRLKELGYLD